MTETSKALDLTEAITIVTEDTDWEEGQTPDRIVAVLTAREELTFDEIHSWEAFDKAAERVHQAYLTVVLAPRDEIAQALRTLES